MPNGGHYHVEERQGGNRTLGERMDLPMFGDFRFQLKRQHFFNRLWQSDQWDLRALGVPLLFFGSWSFDVWLTIELWKMVSGFFIAETTNMMRTNILLLDIFAPSNISCQVIFEVARVLPLVRIQQCLLPRSTAHQLMVSTRSITIPKVFRWSTIDVRRTLRFFFDDGITSWQTRRTHQRGKSYNHRSTLTRAAFSFDSGGGGEDIISTFWRRWCFQKMTWEGKMGRFRWWMSNTAAGEKGAITWRLLDPIRGIRREQNFTRGPCQKVEIRSSKNIEINPDNWNAKKIGIFPRSPTLAEKDVDQPFSNCCSCPLAAFSKWQISEMCIFNILQLCVAGNIFFLPQLYCSQDL